jgi:RimJ/RimL family protein N-acetyltransferase
MLRVYGDAEAMRWVGDGEPLDRVGCEHWIEITHRNYATRGYGMSALIEKQSGEIVGFCGLVHPGGQPEAEIKYAFSGEYWGQGYATEAAIGLLDYGASTHGIDYVIATVAPDNAASQRVLLKSGMQLGELRDNEDGTFTQLFTWRPSSASSETV